MELGTYNYKSTYTCWDLVCCNDLWFESDRWPNTRAVGKDILSHVLHVSAAQRSSSESLRSKTRGSTHLKHTVRPVAQLIHAVEEMHVLLQKENWNSKSVVIMPEHKKMNLCQSIQLSPELRDTRLMRMQNTHLGKCTNLGTRTYTDIFAIRCLCENMHTLYICTQVCH